MTEILAAAKRATNADGSLIDPNGWRRLDEDHCPQDPDGLHHIGCGCQEGHDL